MLSTPQTLQRKKSLPDVAGMPRLPDGSGGMSREEVSALGSARREEVRRMHEETEKLRANPLLYLVSPQVKVRRSPCQGCGILGKSYRGPEMHRVFEGTQVWF